MINKTVLYAEDEDVNFMLVNKVSEKSTNYKYTILRAENGLKAVEMAKTNCIDIILMDIKMPIMNGDEATYKIREFNKTIPIIAYSANDPSMLTEEFKEKITEYIKKPSPMSIIFQTIEKYF